MNIQQAKQEIRHTVRAYLRKDELGHYRFPAVRQRPILLMGPPGIGKTAIMEQLAEELHIGLVSYTMTHHTRQSAVGLPQISEQSYEDEIHAVTRYTMSEIIASVYDAMSQSGCKEGILFLDEINCVSDTLAPTMLQFLQNKTFGTHKLPAGWIICAAGNPPEYNKSVREFDIVTLDRIRTIEIQPDTEAFFSYALSREMHPAILSYLKLHPERFYHVSRQEDRRFYVTARGWEDLSALLLGYEDLEIPVSEELISEYLCLPETSREFYAYYMLYQKYGSDYRIPELLNGECAEQTDAVLKERLKRADFVERFAVTEMLLHGISQSARNYARCNELTCALYDALKACLAQRNSSLSRDGVDQVESYTAKRREAMETKQKFGFLKDAERTKEETLIRILEHWSLELRQQDETAYSDLTEFSDSDWLSVQLQKKIDRQAELRGQMLSEILGSLNSGICWLKDALGQGQELTALLQGISADPIIMRIIAQHGCDAYLAECSCLQVRIEEEELQKACAAICLEENF